ncbi:TetR/AcrR family transcriptional regulator [Levilactobacillus acidifarinae]|uniref:Transcriptional regulator n=1 Tax=Levilactobacillus acidifarinae DSM 19394 = JCM 15949 TaxID=1423715 RepID=A0A0R1LSM8_9LACO|nr:TetR/AcrR family transcriptional regulator [Levilactobacillus acidifarinae]KRK95801.1 transcriptional regulator [Levilactobacillus acidifarinae DSM 19394]GEO70712.1 TetR family transcriptional regulator [Levilactobacillus acidifarinae]
MTTTDKRVLRTQQALTQALEDLAVHHDYQDITVTNLTKAAGINRKTFYLHYNSIDELVNQLADQVTQQLAAIIHQHAIKTVYHHPGLLLDDFVDFAEAHSAAVKRLLFSDDYSRFANRIERQLTQVLADAIQDSYSLSRQDALIAAHFLIHNTLSLFSYFSTQAAGGKIDRDVFKRYVERLNLTGVSTFFN